MVFLFLLFLGALFFLGIRLISNAKTKSLANLANAAVVKVNVINRQRVGLLDTVTIQSSEPSALMHWLNDNGFAAPANIAPVVADYVKAGWIFVAAKLRRDTADAGTSAPQPLSFIFKTAKAVYPLRLTGIGNPSCRIDLYVFGPGRAEAPGFVIQRCETPLYEDSRLHLVPGDIRIRHKELARLVAPAPVATKLSGVLSESDMKRDAFVRWGRYVPSGRTVYTWGAAVTFGVNIISLILVTAWILGWLLSQTKAAKRFLPQRWRLMVVVVSFCIGAAAILDIPKVPKSSLRIKQHVYNTVGNNVIGLVMALEDEMSGTNAIQMRKEMGRSPDSDKLKHWFEAAALDFRNAPQLSESFTNCLTGEALRIEASPGNVILRPSGANYELIWHDFDGAEALTNLVLLDR